MPRRMNAACASIANRSRSAAVGRVVAVGRLLALHLARPRGTPAPAPWPAGARAPTSPATRPGASRAATGSTVRSRNGRPGNGREPRILQDRSIAVGHPRPVDRHGRREPSPDRPVPDEPGEVEVHAPGRVDDHRVPVERGRPRRPTDSSYCAVATRIADIPIGVNGRSMPCMWPTSR